MAQSPESQHLLDMFIWGAHDRNWICKLQAFIQTIFIYWFSSNRMNKGMNECMDGWLDEWIGVSSIHVHPPFPSSESLPSPVGSAFPAYQASLQGGRDTLPATSENAAMDGAGETPNDWGECGWEPRTYDCFSNLSIGHNINFDAKVVKSTFGSSMIRSTVWHQYSASSSFINQKNPSRFTSTNIAPRHWQIKPLRYRLNGPQPLPTKVRLKLSNKAGLDWLPVWCFIEDTWCMYPFVCQR